MFVCSECEYTTQDWLGRCPNCNSFGTIEESSSSSSSSQNGSSPSQIQTQKLTDVDPDEQSRIDTGLSELDRVLGGGMVPGSVVLLGGPPGIGKSTLLLQWGSQWKGDHGPVLYVNGEESGTQISRRAQRIESDSDRIEIVSPDTIEALTENISSLKPSIVMIDSIQTVTSEESNGSPGSMAQLRAVTQQVVDTAKQSNVPFVLIGHVTKEGEIGGPKRLEHMVDTVLYFDDTEKDYRFIRSAKNRFGSTGELGVFEMTGEGLIPIGNPGKSFARNENPEAGSAITISLEGTRPLQVEVQALVTPSQYGTPQRTATGFPQKRLIMIIAVLEKHLGLPLGTQDVFVNVAGGLKLQDPGTDLAMAMAILGSFEELQPEPERAWIGEVGLTGRLRSPAQLNQRIKEAERLNLNSLVVGGGNKGKPDSRLTETISNIRNCKKLMNQSTPSNPKERKRN